MRTNVFNLSKFKKNPDRLIIETGHTPYKSWWDPNLKQVIVLKNETDTDYICYSKDSFYLLRLMPIVNIEYWANVYQNNPPNCPISNLFNSKEKAVEIGKKYKSYIKTIKVHL